MAEHFELVGVMVDRIVERALEEDLSAGDITTESCIDADATAVAHAMARKEMVACGGPVFARTFGIIDGSLVTELHVREGAKVPAGVKLWTVRGRARSILMGERTALNFTQRMSGVATVTRRYVDAVPSGSSTRIVDTRKTTPGLRYLERYAVRIGGGQNHRDHLGSAVLIKDNHVAACGGVARAIERAKKHAYTCKIECEVDTIAQLDEALAAGADIILLDNMDDAMTAEAVKRAKAKNPGVLLEASGGITPERVTGLAKTGVDAISVGGLTHSTPSSDIGLDFE